jgi:hypothetical protein
MRARIHGLQVAQRGGILPVAQVKASIEFEHRQMTLADEYCHLGPVFATKQRARTHAQIVADKLCPFDGG